MPLDAIRDMAARKFLNNYFTGIGKVVDLDIDAKADRMMLKAELLGEVQPIRLDVFYRVEKEALVLESFRCEREWLEVVLNRYLTGKRISIEDKMVQTLLKHLF